DQDGIEIRPIVQLTGDSEFNEVFFHDALTDASLVVDQPGNGWKVAMATLGFERGVSTLAQQVGFARELDGIIAEAGRLGTIDDPVVRERLATALAEIEVIRLHALRTLSDPSADGTQESIAKLLWANWHRRLGETAMLVRGPSALTVADEPYELDADQSLYLFSRADTIYGGSDEIQRNIIAERALGLPREPRP
ncbi:MAG: acyl-CoA dehydrogenase family protein, partial [Ilumatobacteraceae bacterium]